LPAIVVSSLRSTGNAHISDVLVQNFNQTLNNEGNCN